MPASAHWPFAFLSLSFAIDVLTPFHSSLPKSYQLALPGPAELSRIGYYSLTLGLATALPAILTGGAQAVQAISKAGLTDSNGLRPKFKVMFSHALLMDALTAFAAWTWFGRTKDDGVVLDWGRAGAAAAAFVVLVFAAHLGGRLTYGHGMGVFGGTTAVAAKKKN